MPNTERMTILEEVERERLALRALAVDLAGALAEAEQVIRKGTNQPWFLPHHAAERAKKALADAREMGVKP